MNIEKKPKSLILHPFLFAIFPIVSLFSQNLDLLSLNEIIFPLILFLVISAAAWIILRYTFKNSIKSGIIISIVWFIFFSYGYLFSVFDLTIFYGINFIQQHLVLMIPFIGTLVIGILVISRTKRRLNNANTIANVIAIALIAFPLMNIGIYDFQQQDISYENYDIAELQTGGQLYNMPNIYYILLDEYAPQETLLDAYDFDNSEFLNFLNEQGFVAKKSYSNYPTTFQALASILNMQYINWISEEIGEDSTDRHSAFEITANNQVMKILKSKGYIVVNTDSGWEITRNMHIADLNLCGENQLFNSEFLVMTIRNSILNPIYVKMFEPGMRERVLCAFSEIPEAHLKTEKPVFVFSHIMLPHGPYFWGPNGEHLTPKKTTLEHGYDRPIQGYTDQLQFANKKMKEMIEKILSSTERQSIIVIQSDTGPSTNYVTTCQTCPLEYSNVNEKMIRERMSNVSFVYFPTNKEVLYDGMTPVNSFPLIFNTFFDDNYEMLDDRIYFSLEIEPYRHVDVTEFMTEQKNIDLSLWNE